MHLKTKHFLSEKYKVLNWLIAFVINNGRAQWTEYCFDRMEEVSISKYKMRLIYSISIFLRLIRFNI